MPLALQSGELPYKAECDAKDCDNTVEVYGGTLQYAREDLIQSRKWAFVRNVSDPTNPHTLCPSCKDVVKPKE